MAATRTGIKAHRHNAHLAHLPMLKVGSLFAGIGGGRRGVSMIVLTIVAYAVRAIGNRTTQYEIFTNKRSHPGETANGRFAVRRDIGGFDLGLERAGMKTVWQVEIDDYCQRVLAKHWPNVERHRDIHDCGAHNLERVDLVCGGFPCQDISSANVYGRRGLAGQQSGLWSEMRRIVAELSPRWCIVENVGQWRDWVPTVRAGLAGLRYATVPIRLYAGYFGAPHRRARVFVVGDANGNGESVVAIHAEVARLSSTPNALRRWRLPASIPLRMDDGLPGGTQRLRALGNAVVPAVVEWIGRGIVEADNAHLP